MLLLSLPTFLLINIIGQQFCISRDFILLFSIFRGIQKQKRQKEEKIKISSNIAVIIINSVKINYMIVYTINDIIFLCP